MALPEPLPTRLISASNLATDQAAQGSGSHGAALHRRCRLVQRLQRRWPTALGIGAAVVFFADGRPERLTAFAWILIAMAAAYPIIGFARRELGRSEVLGIELGATIAFAAVAVTVMSSENDVARYVLAAGWLGHGLWDVTHMRTGRVVPRQWAEWCGVVDVLGAAAMVLLPAVA